MTRFPQFFRLFILSCLLLLPVSAPARAKVVDLLLVLAVDISRSVDAEEFDMQRQGYAQALTHPEVITAIRSGAVGSIAVSYFEWSGAGQQVLILDWTVIDSLETAQTAVSRIMEADRSFYGYTSLSEAIDMGRTLIAASPHEGFRQVIDISGDGSNNAGRSLNDARAEALAAGITINGLPILNNRPNPFGRAELNLDEYYATYVIGGPGAFQVPALGFESFSQAIRAKLIKEIAALPVPSSETGMLPQ